MTDDFSPFRETATPFEPPPAFIPARPRAARAGRVIRGTARAVVTFVAAGTICAAAMLTANSSLLHSPAAQAQDPNLPTPGFESSVGPLGLPQPAPAEGGPYAFLGLQPDGVTPVTYDPCRPIHYVIRPDNAPPGGEQLLHDGIARVSYLTGLKFTYDGPTTETDRPDRPAFQRDVYGDRWAPVLINWSTTIEDPDLATDVAGQAGSAQVNLSNSPGMYVTGHMDLDAAFFTTLLTDPTVHDGPAQARAIVLHELGHLVGLDHVEDPTQLMNPVDVGNRDFQPGDLTGLAALGGGPCVPDL